MKSGLFKRLSIICGISILVLPMSGTSFADEATRLTNPNAVSVEGLGRGLLYSIDFDRVLNDDMAAGFGFGTSGTQNPDSSSSSQTATLFPVYINYYFMRDQGSLYVTAGAAIVTNYTSLSGLKASVGGLKFPNSVLLPEFGAGYESRGDSGFLFRVTAYGIVGQNVIPWVGFAFGFAF